MIDFHPFTTLSWVTLIALTTYLLFLRKGRSRSLPPGPKPLPLLGNIRDLPSKGDKEWQFWSKHKDLYGPISSISALGNNIIILNDYEIAVELLERRGNIHSGRPQQVFFGEMVGWGKHTAFLRYNDEFRYQRKQIHGIIGTQAAIKQFRPLQDAEINRFLFRVLKSPDELLQHCRHLTSAVLLKMLYGYNAETTKLDPLISAVDVTMEEFAWAASPGTWLVDFIPALKHVPEWLPGTQFKQIARQMRKRMLTLCDVPLQFVQKKMAANTHSPSFASIWIERVAKIGGEEGQPIKTTAMALFTGGSDTTTATLQTFFLAIALHPGVQQQAQEEIDRVIGSNRLPVAEDRGELPYIEAVFKEAARWHPIATMGLPHEAASDDVYQGFVIPKGAILQANVWGFAHNKEIYPEPEAFRPERFLGPNPAQDPRTYQFGFGRRRCPAVDFADAIVWLTIARTLAVFNISKPSTLDGAALAPDEYFDAGIVSRPKPFKAHIEARSARHKSLIENAELSHAQEESHGSEVESLL